MPSRVIAVLGLIVALLTPNTAFAGDTPGSISFDGSQNITTTLSSAPGTGNFTFEFWFYLTDATSPNQGLMNTRSGNTRDGLDAIVNPDNGTSGLLGVSYRGRWLLQTAAGSIQSQKWYHLALIRTATNTLKIYLDGNLQSTITLDGDGQNFSSTFLIIGARGGFNSAISGRMTGNISNFRYTKSIVYATNFTPIRSTLDLLTDTKVLLKTFNDSTFLNDSAIGSNGFTNNGGASVSSLSPFVEPITDQDKQAREALEARVASQKRVDDARRKLIQEIQTGSFISSMLLESAEYYGGNPQNISKINIEIYQKISSDADSLQIVQQITSKFQLLEKLSRGIRVYYPELVYTGVLGPQDSIYRAVTMRYFKSIDARDLSTESGIRAAATEAIKEYEYRKKRVTSLVARYAR